MPRSYRTEFPDFDYEMPTYPGFHDESWKNDVCPKMVSYDEKIIVWTDYNDPKLRENEDGKKFTICNGEEHPNPILFESNDWDQVVAMLNLIRLALNVEAVRNGDNNRAPIGSRRVVELI